MHSNPTMGNGLSVVKVMKTENLTVVTVCVFPCNRSHYNINNDFLF